jgi:predicted NBD/HSP70 family sugar kinase
MRGFIERLADTSVRQKQSLQTRQILQYFLQEGEKTIPELCHFAQVSIPTATKIIQELVEQGILKEVGKRESSGGRRPSVYALNAEMGYIVGVELLLKSFRLSVVNLNQEVIYEYEADNFDISRRDESFSFLVKTVPQIIKNKNFDETKILGIGIGITGRVDRKSGLSYSYLHYEKPLVQLLGQHWRFPVFIENDTRLMTLGEQTFGLARGKAHILYVNLSRGLGLGLISNGTIHDGKSGFAGEFGHIPFKENDKLCVCGKHNCLETEVSGIALEAAYKAETGIEKSYRDILKSIKTNDALAQKLVSAQMENLGQALSILVQVFNPERIILGGRYAEVGDWLTYPVLKGLNLHGLPRLVGDTDVIVSDLGEKAEMLGAYALVMENVFQ